MRLYKKFGRSDQFKIIKNKLSQIGNSNYIKKHFLSLFDFSFFMASLMLSESPVSILVMQVYFKQVET